MTKAGLSALLGLLILSTATSARAVDCGDAVFISAATYPVTSPVPTELVIADFNGDGFPDIATLGDYYYYETSISILLGNPDGTFQEAHTAGSIDYGFAMAAGQFDAGPTVDLVVTTGADSVAFLAGVGDGTFAPPVFSTFPDPTQLPVVLATGDFNEDGDLDLAGGGSVRWRSSSATATARSRRPRGSPPERRRAPSPSATSTETATSTSRPEGERRGHPPRQRRRKPRRSRVVRQRECLGPPARRHRR